jgi:hypothetical protein
MKACAKLGSDEKRSDENFSHVPPTPLVVKQMMQLKKKKTTIGTREQLFLILENIVL